MSLTKMYMVTEKCRTQSPAFPEPCTKEASFFIEFPHPPLKKGDTMFKMKVNMLEGSIFKALIAFMIPFMISNLFQQMYNTVDTIIVGKVLGESSLAAIGSSSVLYELLIGFALGIGNGMSIVTARSYGAGDFERMKKSVAGSLVIGAIVTIVLVAAAQCFCYPVLKLMNTPADILEEAYSYINTITLFVGVMLAYNLCSGILKAVGNSIMPLIFLIISSILNVVLDILFIAEFGMGVRGAAVATVIAQMVSVVLCVIYIFWKYPELLPEKKHFKPEGSMYGDLAGQGISMGLMSCLVSAGTVIMQSSINNLGYLTIAGHTAAKKIRSMTLNPIIAVATSMTTFVSQNRGADQGLRIRKAVRYGNLIGLGWAVFISVVLLFTAPAIIGFVSGSANEEVLKNGALYLQIESPFFAVLSVLFNTRYALQGIGSKVLPLVSSIIELLGKVVFAFLFIPIMGYMGVILCEPVIWCFMVLELVIAFYMHPYIKAHKYA